MSNLACFIRGCTNPVTGQCQGYKGNCGQFYCAEHSSSRLCGDCAKRKAENDEVAERERELQNVLARYNSAGQQCYDELKRTIDRDGPHNFTTLGCFGVVVLAIAVVFVGGSVFNNVALGLVLMVIILTLLVPLVKYGNKRREGLENEIMTRYESELPGFKEFYEVWLKQKKDLNERQFKEGLATFGKVLLVGAAVADSYRVERDIRSIAKNTGNIADSTDDIARTVRKINQKL